MAVNHGMEFLLLQLPVDSNIDIDIDIDMIIELQPQSSFRYTHDLLHFYRYRFIPFTDQNGQYGS